MYYLNFFPTPFWLIYKFKKAKHKECVYGKEVFYLKKWFASVLFFPQNVTLFRNNFIADYLACIVKRILLCSFF